MQKIDDPGKFRQVDEIIYVVGYPGYQHLSSIAENCMQVVCDVKGDNILPSYLQFSFWFIMLDGMSSHIYGVFNCIPLPLFLLTDVGMTKFFRLNDEKVLKWLCMKVRFHPLQARI